MSVNRKRLKKDHGIIHRVLTDILLKIKAFFNSDKPVTRALPRKASMGNAQADEEGGEGSGDIGRLEASGAVSYDSLKVNYYYLMREYGDLEARAMISRHIGQDLTKEQLSELSAQEQLALIQENIKERKRNPVRNEPELKPKPAPKMTR